MTPIIQRQIVTGEPIKVGELTAQPQSQVWSIQLPFGGFVWHRPTAIRLKRNGQTETLLISDPTRGLLFALGSVTVVLSIGSFFIRLIMRKRSGS